MIENPVRSVLNSVSINSTHPSASFPCTAMSTGARTHQSHNGCNLGKAFVREQGRAIGRYRVIAPNGLKCRVGIDAESAVVETFSPGTVLQVSQVCLLAPLVAIRRLVPGIPY